MSIRERIARAAADVFAEAGYRGATTRRIAQRAGVNEVTIFRHFGSKQDLIRQAIEEARPPLSSDGSLPLRPVDPHTELTAWAEHHLQALRQARAMIRASLGESQAHPDILRHVVERPARAQQQLVSYLRALQAHGMARAQVSADAGATLLIGSLLLDALGRDVMPDLFGYGEEQTSLVCVDLLLRAMGVAGNAMNGEAVK
jgi:AcrR family transcriptional regulator